MIQYRIKLFNSNIIHIKCERMEFHGVWVVFYVTECIKGVNVEIVKYASNYETIKEITVL